MCMKVGVASKFNVGMVSSALKALWDHAGDDLSRLGLVYHNRRNADKYQLFECVFTDLVSAFETLDGEDTLPDIYCEANDLLSLPTLELDPVSKQLETTLRFCSP